MYLICRLTLLAYGRGSLEVIFVFRLSSVWGRGREEKFILQAPCDLQRVVGERLAISDEERKSKRYLLREAETLSNS